MSDSDPARGSRFNKVASALFPPSSLSGYSDPGPQADKCMGEAWGADQVSFLGPFHKQGQRWQKGKRGIRFETGILTWTGPNSSKEKYSETCEVGLR